MQMTDGTQMNILNLFCLEKRRALVTGGAKGLGRVMAQALAEAGAEVAVASRTLADCQTAAAEITASTGRRTFAAAADMTKAKDVERLKQEVEAGFGTVDILVNNAGINIRGNINELSEADFFRF